MKQYKYTGFFRAKDTGHTYELEVYSFGFLQAFFLLTADAIRSGNHYQLSRIVREDGLSRLIGDILKCSDLIIPIN